MLDGLFLATLFCVTFEKVHWNVAGAVGIADVLAICFLLAFALGRAGRGRGGVPRTATIVLVFAFAFLLVYLIGFYNLETSDALAQFAKGMVKFVIHFAFLAVGVTYLARRGLGFYWRSLGWLTAGLVVNAVYGVLQLADARLGGNLDQTVLAPLTGGASSINVYGAVNGQSVYRPNALTGDPNHLGIMLIVPLLVLLPVYLRLERGHRFRTPLALTLAFLLIVELATLSRSGLLGLGVGLLILVLPYRRYLRSRALIYPLAAVVVLLGAFVYSRRHFFSVVLRSRVQTGGGSTSVHFSVYSFIPAVFHQHPLFGLGLNNFSIYYQFVTGKSNWGPHSFYVALMVETGIVGTALFAVFLWWIFRRLQVARALGRALAAAGDPGAARLRPLAWGLTAALAGTMASNAFYLTMQFYYFYALIAFALAAPLVYGRRR
ncbi:MAG TPA: O-antigen ligase family protein [Gaiellaceae bacterium]|nr:O-antigen ligase family protein [Gaiellaceae bacterium]